MRWRRGRVLLRATSRCILCICRQFDEVNAELPYNHDFVSRVIASDLDLYVSAL